jgi:hypothetical protein
MFCGAIFGVKWELATLHQKVRSKKCRRGATCYILISSTSIDS